jgi:hypothetical protein
LGLADALYNNSGLTYVAGAFRRAPSFFDEVCYTGTGGIFNFIYTNLGVVPELIITKVRGASGNWYVAATPLGNANSQNANNLYLNSVTTTQNDGAFANTSNWYSSGYYTGTNAATTNASGANYVSYLFATCPGVSKVGSYTGTGAVQTINCGFTGGARWVMIKRTDDNGDWYVWDTARGMTSGTDPSLRFNSSAAEVNADSVWTVATGFQVVTIAAGINQPGGNYIFLAIA